MPLGLSPSTMFNAVSLALAVLGVVLTIYGTRKTLERKDPRLYCAYFEKIALTENPVPGVEITFEGRAVERVTTTFVWFWNAGRRPIHRSDIPTSQPIRIAITDLQHQVDRVDPGQR